jgi:sterol desaturase/sphingolipid hydroxylase (fatty acid hydroxylase superfamily)
MTTWEIVTLVAIGLLGHAMALFWFIADKQRWKVCGRKIYDLPIQEEQVTRELRNSLHAPIHTVILGAFICLGYFKNHGIASYVGSVITTLIWAEIWHYASHRAFHLKSLHWIHREHHKSHLNSPFTAISFSFTEKLVFDVGLLVPLALLDRIVGMNFYGIATWYLGYLAINSFSHANFELKSEDYNRWIGRIVTSTTYHSLHHSRYLGNFGLGTRVLDRLFKTEWRDYERLYDRISKDRRPLSRLSEKVDPAPPVSA